MELQKIEITREEIVKQVEDWATNKIGTEFNFRKYQKEKIVDIIENIVSTRVNHNHIVEAPTGSGKSIIVMISAGVLAEYYNIWSYILCSDLYLWDQYANFIKKHKQINFGMIKGQTGNYECSINHEDMRNADCRMCGLSWASLFNKKKATELGYECAAKCEYVQARKKCIKTPVVLMTYQMFLYQINVVTTQQEGNNTFTNRPVIFCDECHNIPEIVQNKMTPTIRKSDFEKFEKLYNWAFNRTNDLFCQHQYSLIKEFPTLEQLYDTCCKIFDTEFVDETRMLLEDLTSIQNYVNMVCLFKEITDEIQQDISQRKLNKQPIGSSDLKLYKVTSFLTNYMCYWNDFCSAISEAGSEYLIKQVAKDEEGEVSVQFSCTKEDWMVYRYILSQADFKVMLSATVGGKEPFEENIGTKYTEDGCSMFDVIPSTFNFEKSPVIFFSRYKMSYADKERSFAALKPMIYKMIEERFANKKGIIQTGNYDLARKLVFDAPANLAKRMMLYNGSKEKTKIIKKHQKAKNTILVGPTLMEGVDLPDDDCRFVVILKMPYPNMKDKLVAAKMKLFPLWYNSKTSNSIIQGIGRGVRNENDWCQTYILDGCFYNLYINTKDQYSKELQDRIKLIN